MCACVATDATVEWQTPKDIADTISQISSLCQADCGSVEFFYDEKEDGEGSPIYFDVNMLSSLPDRGDYY